MNWLQKPRPAGQEFWKRSSKIERGGGKTRGSRKALGEKEAQAKQAWGREIAWCVEGQEKEKKRIE